MSTWLLSIARNIAIDTIRLRRAEPIDPQALVALGTPAKDPSPDERGMVVAELERLRKALLELPVEQRRALLLASLYGRTAREISELENVPLGTVKTRIRTGMLRLRAALEVSDDI